MLSRSEASLIQKREMLRCRVPSGRVMTTQIIFVKAELLDKSYVQSTIYILQSAEGELHDHRTIVLRRPLPDRLQRPRCGPRAARSAPSGRAGSERLLSCGWR